MPVFFPHETGTLVANRLENLLSSKTAVMVTRPRKFPRLPVLQAPFLNLESFVFPSFLLI